jgi:membrane protease YdiL (CAAX protease family)
MILVTLILIVIGVLLVNAGLLIAWALRRDAAAAGLAPPLFAPRWSLVDVWIGGQLIVVAMAVVLITTMFGLGVVMGMRGETMTIGPDGGLPTTFLWVVPLTLLPQNALLALVPILFVKYKYRMSLEEFGLRFPPRGREWLLGGLAGLGMLLLVLPLALLMNWLLGLILGPEQMQALTRFSDSFGVQEILDDVRKNPALYLSVLIGGAVLAPIGEEIFFRGFVYNCVRQRLGRGWGLSLSAGLFSLVHLGPLVLLPIFLVGIALALAYERSGSLWVPIFMHATFNGVQLIAAYFGVTGP